MMGIYLPVLHCLKRWKGNGSFISFRELMIRKSKYSKMLTSYCEEIAGIYEGDIRDDSGFFSGDKHED